MSGWESWLVGTVSRALAFGTPLLWATLGEVYAERAGVVNLGIEGMMALGALFGFSMAKLTGNPWLGVLVAALAGGVASLIHAFLAVTLRANQYVSGLALTMFGLGLSGLLGRGWTGQPLFHPLKSISIPGLADIPYLGPMLFQKQSVLLYLGVGLAVLMWFILFHTRWGLVIRAVGESPATADAMGINVFAVRYLCVFIGGLLAGVAGGFLSIEYRPSWTEGMTAGMGWIAIALTIFVAWDPIQALGGAFLFGALYHLSYRLQQFVPPSLLKTIPYVAAILVLAMTATGAARRRRGAPSALGIPYLRGER